MLFRNLKSVEIALRVKTIGESGLSLIPYIDAKTCEDILDEAVGEYNWQRLHGNNNKNCIVSIWDERKQQWIAKEDTGTAAYTEAEKSTASDSFKRACYVWGIARELRTAPFVWVDSKNCSIKKKKNGSLKCDDKFVIRNITISNKKVITGFKIVNESRGVCVYSLVPPLTDEIKQLMTDTDANEEGFLKYFHVKEIEDLSHEQEQEALAMLKKKVELQRAKIEIQSKPDYDDDEGNAAENIARGEVADAVEEPSVIGQPEEKEPAEKVSAEKAKEPEKAPEAEAGKQLSAEDLLQDIEEEEAEAKKKAEAEEKKAAAAERKAKKEAKAHDDALAFKIALTDKAGDNFKQFEGMTVKDAIAKVDGFCAVALRDTVKGNFTADTIKAIETAGKQA